MSDSTALTIPQPNQLAAMFKTEKGLDPLLAEIEAKAMAMVKDLDPASKKDRDLMKSAAYKVSQSKSEIDRAGKALTETQRKEVDAVNAGRNVADKFLTALRDKVKKSAEDWEAAEELRISGIKAHIAAIRNHGATLEDASGDIRAKAEALKDTVIGDEYGEFRADAIAAIELTLGELRLLYGAVKRQEDDAAELARLRAEADARAEIDRIVAENEAARIAAIAFAEAEGEAIRQEAARVARIETEKQEAADRARIAAELKAKADADQAAQDAKEREAALIAAQVAADARHAMELAKAAQAERDRLADVQRIADQARALREADLAHRAKITAEIADALRTMAGRATPELIAEAIMDGKIPHIEVKL